MSQTTPVPLAWNPSCVPLANQSVPRSTFGIVHRVGNPIGTDHMHVALATVHYHADVVKGVSVLIVHDVDVVSGRLDVRVAAKRARKYIRNDFPSARPRLADYFTQALGNIIPNTAERLALPVDRTRNRLKAIRELNEVGGVDDDGIAMRSADTISTSIIKHFPVHPLRRQTNPHRTC